MFKKIKYSLLNIRHGTANIVVLMPVIWRYRSYDITYSLQILQKLYELEAVRHRNCNPGSNSEKIAKVIENCSKALKDYIALDNPIKGVPREPYFKRIGHHHNDDMRDARIQYFCDTLKKYHFTWWW